MAEISFRVPVSSNKVLWTLTALLVLAAAPELGSEQVTLSTYYPAPSGVYTKLVATKYARVQGPGTACQIYTYPYSGTTLCPVGTYATYTTGLYADSTMLPPAWVETLTTGQMYCCPR